MSESQPSHTTVSQKTVVLKKDISTYLTASSQKGVVIEKSSQPAVQHKRVRDTEATQSPTQTYTRKKKAKTQGDAQGTHTAEKQVLDLVSMPSQIQLDVTPTNEESQPHSLIIETLQTPNSPTQSQTVDMISTSILDSPSLKFKEKPHSEVGDHHLLDDLLDHQPFLSDLVEKSVPQHLKSISTDSTIISTPSSIPFSLSTDISHPLISDCPSTRGVHGSGWAG